MDTAFQSDAFQNDAFQIAAVGCAFDPLVFDPLVFDTCGDGGATAGGKVFGAFAERVPPLDEGLLLYEILKDDDEVLLLV